MGDDFFLKINKFNDMYGIDSHDKPKLLGLQRLENFKNIILEEVQEVDEIIEKYKQAGDLTEEKNIEILTELSDWLGDLIVFSASEARRFGIDMKETLDIIMDSNFSKLGADGKRILDERGKVMKGPNYWKPEPKISEMLKSKLKIGQGRF